jgi:hypothetical protein
MTSFMNTIQAQFQSDTGSATFAPERKFSEHIEAPLPEFKCNLFIVRIEFIRSQVIA